jgi:predicted nucleotidyltransferase
MHQMHQDFLKLVVQRLVDTVHPEQIILFGSYARGEEHPHSDMDILVVETEHFITHRNRYQEMALLEKTIGRTPIALDLLVFSKEEVDHFRNSVNHIVARALREGKILYARPDSSSPVYVEPYHQENPKILGIGNHSTPS